MRLDEGSSKGGWRPSLFTVTLPLCLAIGAFGVVTPDRVAALGAAGTRVAFGALDWFFMLTVSGTDLESSVVLAQEARLGVRARPHRRRSSRPYPSAVAGGGLAEALFTRQ